MKIEKLMVVSIIILALLMIGAVSASENSSDDLSADEEVNLEEISEVEKTTDSLSAEVGSDEPLENSVDTNLQDNGTSYGDMGLNPNITVSIGNVVAGSPTTINITANDDVTGNIFLTINSQEMNMTHMGDMVNGKCSFVFNLEEGDYKCIVDYPGDEKYSSRQIFNDFIVTKLYDDIDITINETYYEYLPILININVNKTFNNNVSVFISSVSSDLSNYNIMHNVSIVNGSGELIISGLPQGFYDITVDFGDNEIYPNYVEKQRFAVKWHNFESGVISDEVSIAFTGHIIWLHKAPDAYMNSTVTVIMRNNESAVVYNKTRVLTKDKLYGNGVYWGEYVWRVSDLNIENGGVYYIDVICTTISNQSFSIASGNVIVNPLIIRDIDSSFSKTTYILFDEYSSLDNVIFNIHSLPHIENGATDNDENATIRFVAVNIVTGEEVIKEYKFINCTKEFTLQEIGITTPGTWDLRVKYVPHDGSPYMTDGIIIEQAHYYNVHIGDCLLDYEDVLITISGYENKTYTLKVENKQNAETFEYGINKENLTLEDLNIISSGKYYISLYDGSNLILSGDLNVFSQDDFRVRYSYNLNYDRLWIYDNGDEFIRVFCPEGIEGKIVVVVKNNDDNTTKTIEKQIIEENYENGLLFGLKKDLNITTINEFTFIVKYVGDEESYDIASRVMRSESVDRPQITIWNINFELSGGDDVIRIETPYGVEGNFTLYVKNMEDDTVNVIYHEITPHDYINWLIYGLNDLEITQAGQYEISIVYTTNETAPDGDFIRQEVINVLDNGGNVELNLWINTDDEFLRIQDELDISVFANVTVPEGMLGRVVFTKDGVEFYSKDLSDFDGNIYNITLGDDGKFIFENLNDGDGFKFAFLDENGDEIKGQDYFIRIGDGSVRFEIDAHNPGDHVAIDVENEISLDRDWDFVWINLPSDITEGSVKVKCGDYTLFEEAVNFEEGTHWWMEVDGHYVCSFAPVNLNWGNLTTGDIVLFGFYNEDGDIIASKEYKLTIEGDNAYFKEYQRIYAWSWPQGDEGLVLYSDTNETVASVKIPQGFEGEISIYVNDDMKNSFAIEYQNEEDWIYYEWRLQDLKISQSGEYNIVIKHNDEIILNKTLTVVDFEYNTFRVVVDYDNLKFRLYSPEDSYGIVNIITRDSDENVLGDGVEYEITSDDCGKWKEWSYEELGIEREGDFNVEFNIFQDDERVFSYSNWIYWNGENDNGNFEVIIYVTEDDITTDVDDDRYGDLIAGFSLPRDVEGTIIITSDDKTLFEKDLLEFTDPDEENDEGFENYLVYNINITDLNLDGVNDGDEVKFAFIYNDEEKASKYYIIHFNDEENLINFEHIGEDDEESFVSNEQLITDVNNENYTADALVATYENRDIVRITISSGNATFLFNRLLTDDDWIDDVYRIYLKDLNLTNVKDKDIVRFIAYNSEDNEIEDYTSDCSIEVGENYIRFYRIDGEQIFDFNAFYGNLTKGDLNNDELMGWHPRGNFITVEKPETVSEITITVTADGFTKTFTINDMEEDFDYWVLDYIYSIRLTNEIINSLPEDKVLTFNLMLNDINVTQKRIRHGDYMYKYLIAEDFTQQFMFDITDELRGADEVAIKLETNTNRNSIYIDFGGGYFIVYVNGTKIGDLGNISFNTWYEYGNWEEEDEDYIEKYAPDKVSFIRDVQESWGSELELFRLTGHIQGASKINITLADLGITEHGIYNIRITHYPSVPDGLDDRGEGSEYAEEYFNVAETELYNVNITFTTPEYIEEINVTSSNLGDIFDSDGVLKANVGKIIFKGEFDIPTLVINKPVTIIGDKATFTNTTFIIESRDVSITGLILNHESGVGDDYAIYLNNADNFLMMNSNIRYTGITNGFYINNALRIKDSSNVSVSNNFFIIDIPSVDVVWVNNNENYIPAVNSAGIYIDSSNHINMEDNYIGVNYNSVSGSYDTLYGVYVKNSDEVCLKDNIIIGDGSNYLYAVAFSNSNFCVENSLFNLTSSYYACAVSVDESGSGIINANIIEVHSRNNTYSIYAGVNTQVNVTNNKISAHAYFASGVYGKIQVISSNTITLAGNHTIGIAVMDDAIVNSNIITLTASNVGNELIWNDIGVETAGIKTISSALISNNTIISNAKAISVVNGNSTISNNNLTGYVYIERGNNTVIFNDITTDDDYAVDLTESSGNIVKYNNLNAKVFTGNAAVKYVSEDNEIENRKFTDIVITANDALVGENILVKIDLASDATGNVTLQVNGMNYTLPIVNGSTNHTIDDLQAGTYTLRVIYSGDVNYAESVNTTEFTVVGSKLDSIITIDDVALIIGESATFTAKVNGVACDDIIFTVNGEKIATIYYVHAAGEYVVDALFMGNATHNAADATRTFIVNKMNAEFTNISVSTGLKTIITLKMIASPGGYVTVSINNNNYSIVLDSEGMAILFLPLENGNYTLTAYYSGDMDYNEVTSEPVYFTVNNLVKTTPTIIINAPDIYYDQNVTIDVEILDATGNITVTVSQVVNSSGSGENSTVLPGMSRNYHATLVDGKIHIQDNPLVLSGKYNIVVSYGGDDKYLPCENTTQFNVLFRTKVNPDISVNAANITVGEDLIINVAINNDATGSVQIDISDNMYNVSVNNGSASLNVPGLGAGEYTIKLSYSGDENYKAVYLEHNVAIFDVKTAPVLIIEAYNIYEGQNLTINVVLPGDATGNVEVFVREIVEYNPLSNETTITSIPKFVELFGGKAQVIFSGLTVGKYNITVSYDGDENYLSSTNTSQVEVLENKKEIPSILITAGDIIYGETLYVGVNLPGDATGSVQLNIGGKYYNLTVNNGTAFLPIPGLTAGDYSIYASYSGDEKYAFASATSNVRVNKLNSTVSIDDVALIIGESATFTGKVNGVESSDLVFTINGVEGNVIDSISAGNYTVVAVFSGNDTHNAANAVKTFTVSKLAGQFDRIITEDVFVGTESIITIKMHADESGYVTLLINGTNYTAVIIDKVATFNVALDVGNYQAIGYYSGDDKYTAAMPIHGTVVVNDKLESVVIIDDAKLEIGKNTTFTARVNGEISDDLIISVNGVVGDTVSVYAGSYSVTAIFNGNATHKAANVTRTFSIGKENVSVTIDDVNLTIGESATFTGKVNGVESSDLVFTINGMEGNVIDSISAGNYTVVAVFNGNDTHNAANAVKTFTVSKLAGQFDRIITEDVFVGTESIITIKMHADESSYVTLLINGTNYTAVIIDKVATFNVALDVGSYEAIGYYSGDDKYTEAMPIHGTVVVKDKLESVVTIDDAKLEIGKNTTFTARVNGEISEDVIISVNGIVGDTVTVYAGTYNVTAIFKGNTTHKAVNATKTFSIGKENVSVTIDDVNLTIGGSATFTGKVNGVSSSDLVFTINGVEGNVIDSVGAGNYTVVAVFNGNITHNANSATRTFTVDKIDSSVVVRDIVFNYGETGSTIIELTGASHVNASVVDYPNAQIAYLGDNEILISGLDAGSYTLKVVTIPDANHNAVTVNASITVNKVDSNVEISPVEFTYTESATVKVNLTGATGIVAGVIGQADDTVSVDGNTITVSGLKTGSYILSVTTLPDSNHNSVSVNTTVTVKAIMVTSDNLNNYFDEDGVLTTDKDELMFVGTFNDLNLIIARPITLLSDNAVFTNSKFNITSSNVLIDGITFNYEGAESVISAEKISNFTFKNSIINYVGKSNNYIINVTNSTNVDINSNVILANGTEYIHGIIISADNFKIVNNTILISNVTNACGVNILGPSRGVVENNYLDIKAENNIYSINTNPSTGSLRVSYIRNSINAEAYFVVGIYDDSEEIRQNKLNIKATYAIGVVVLSQANVEGNSIGLATEDSGEDNPENITKSTAIQVKNNATISNNVIDSTANSIDVVEGSSDISNNQMVGSVNVLSDGNKISGNIITPTAGESAIDLGNSAGNTVTTNEFYSNKTDASELIKSENENNVIKDNYIKSTVNLTKETLVFDYASSDSTGYNTTGASGVTVSVINHTEAVVKVTKTNITVSNLTPGSYVLNVTTVPLSENYSPTTVLVNITVNKVGSSVNISVTDGVFNTTKVIVNIEVVNQTSLIFNITQNGESIQSGDVSILNSTLAGLGAGKYTITITNIDNGIYTESMDTKEFTIAKATSLVNITPIVSVDYNTPINVEFGVVNATNVTYVVKFQNGTEAIANTTVGDGIVIPVLNAGEYILIIANAENNNYTGDLKQITFTVNKINSSVVFDKPGIVFIAGESGNVTVEVTGAIVTEGNIHVNSTDAVIAFENNVITVSNLTAGSYTLKVTTTPDENHNSVTASVNITVSAAAIDPKFKITVTADKADLPVIINVTADVAFTGYVVVNINGTIVTVSLIQGEGSNTTVLNAGNYNAVINFTATSVFTADYTNTTFKVKVVPVNPDLTVSVDNVSVGSPVVVFITTNTTFSGNVTVKIGSANKTAVIKDGVGNATFTDLTADEYIAFVIFNETEFFTASEKNTTFAVKRFSPDLTVSVDNVSVGSSVVVFITTNTTFSGNVTVKIGSANKTAVIKDGVGNVSFTGLAAGEHIAVVIFNETEYFTASDKNATFTVKKIDPDLDVHIDEVYEGSDIIVVISTNNAFTGNVTVKTDKESINASVVGGKGNATLSGYAAGSHTVSVIFGETDTFTAGLVNDTAVVNVNPVDPGLTVSVANIKQGESALVSISTNSTFTGDVTVKIDSASYIISVVKGAGSLSVGNLAVGVHTATVIFAATDLFKSSEKSATFTVAKKADVISLVLKKVTVKKSAKKLTLQATLKINGKAVKGKKITFKFNGKKYTAKTSNKGVAKVTVKKAVLKKLKVGKKVTYSAKYSTKTVKKTVKVKK